MKLQCIAIEQQTVYPDLLDKSPRSSSLDRFKDPLERFMVMYVPKVLFAGAGEE